MPRHKNLRAVPVVLLQSVPKFPEVPSRRVSVHEAALHVSGQPGRDPPVLEEPCAAHHYVAHQQRQQQQPVGVQQPLVQAEGTQTADRL